MNIIVDVTQTSSQKVNQFKGDSALILTLAMQGEDTVKVEGVLAGHSMSRVSFRALMHSMCEQVLHTYSKAGLDVIDFIDDLEMSSNKALHRYVEQSVKSSDTSDLFDMLKMIDSIIKRR
jgi:hypothetical protein